MAGSLALPFKNDHRASYGYPEHVLGEVLIFVFGGPGIFGQKCPVFGLEGIGNVTSKKMRPRATCL